MESGRTVSSPIEDWLYEEALALTDKDLATFYIENHDVSLKYILALMKK